MLVDVDASGSSFYQLPAMPFSRAFWTWCGSLAT